MNQAKPVRGRKRTNTKDTIEDTVTPSKLLKTCSQTDGSGQLSTLPNTQAFPELNVPAETRVSDLTVENLNKIMWQNMVSMQQFLRLSLVTDMRTIMIEHVKQENSKVLQTVDQKIAELRENVVLPENLTEQLNPIQNEQKIMKEKISNLQNLTEKLTDVVNKQQGFLNSIDSERRSHNMIIKGLIEDDAIEHDEEAATSDDEKLAMMLTAIGLDTSIIVNTARLGEKETGPGARPRLIKLVLKQANDRQKVMSKASKLKDILAFKSVYIEKDRPPAERREMGRIRKVFKEEKAKPENQGRNVVLDHKNRSVLVDDKVVDKYNPSFLT